MSLWSPTGVYGKDTWQPGIVEQLENYPGLLFTMIDRAEPDRIEGNRTYFKLRTGDALSVNMVAQGGDFPTPIDGTYLQGIYETERIAASAGLTFDEWEMLNSGSAAGVPIVQEKMEMILRKTVREIARQTYGDGSGILARCGNTSTSNTVVLQTTATNQYDRDRVNWLEANRVLVDIVHGTTGATVATDRRVTAVADDYSTITIDGASVSTTSGTHVITVAKNVGAFSSGTYVSGEFDGLAQVMKTDRPYLGINSATAGQELWDAVIVRGSSPGTPEAFTLNRLQRLWARMANRNIDGTMPTAEQGYALFSNLGPQMSALNALQSAVRYVDSASASRPNLGFTTMQGLGLDWYGDIHYQNNVIDCLRIPTIKKVIPKNRLQDVMEFVTNGAGEMWHLANAATGQGHATRRFCYLTGRMGVCTLKPSDHGRLDDVIANGGTN